VALAALPVPAMAAPVTAGAHTHGGAVAGGRVLHVTTLADSGPGSLRAAIRATGPRVVVFDVAGIIRLASDMKIARPDITIAGQSAPAPGITLTGGSLRVRASDVVLQHFAVRPGPGATAGINGNRDAITVGGGKRKLHDIRIENVSLSWAVDEDSDIAGGTRNITFRNSILAEALRNAGHPKGQHSMGMLINKDNQGVAVTGNLFAANMFRNPVIARSASAFVGYNLIADAAENAIHFYAVGTPNPLRATVIGNVVEAGPDSDSNVTAVQIPGTMAQKAPNARIYVADNRATPGPLTNPGHFPLAGTPPVTLANSIAPPQDVPAFVLRHAGARPAGRDVVDRRIVAAVKARTERVIDSPSTVGGLAAIQPVHRVAIVPDRPFSPSGLDGQLRIQSWLCLTHLAVGGPNTPQCPRPVDAYRRALDMRLSQGR
jgi:pectate lyase